MLTSHILKQICGDCGAELRSSVLGVLKKGALKGYCWSGNVRELEQAIRRIMLTGSYEGDTAMRAVGSDRLSAAVETGALTARELVEKYCQERYATYGNYGEVARRTDLDWRTVKKNVGG